MPGTDTNVTPEMLAPTMPKATIYQGALRRALKNVSLSPLRLVSLLMPKSTAK